MSIFIIKLCCSSLCTQKTKLIIIIQHNGKDHYLIQASGSKNFYKEITLFSEGELRLYKTQQRSSHSSSPYCSIFNFLEVLELATDKSKMQS